MIARSILADLQRALGRQPAAALLGPRQVGKTTLARQLAQSFDGLYLDLENFRDLEKLTDPRLFLAAHENRLVVFDEVQRSPGLFEALRGIIDEGRTKGLKTGRFLLLGSASLELLRQSGETLAGRIAFLEMTPLHALEVPEDPHESLWTRGGFPESYLSKTDALSLEWRVDLIRTYLERDIPQFGPRIPAETLRRFWTMLAHNQGGLHNASKVASGLEISPQTASRYTDLLVDLLLVRRLQPYHVNVGKRLVKSPKLYIRDSGLLHALLNLRDRDALLGHPVVGGSWEGYVIENLLSAGPARAVPGFYRTSGGAEVDLVLEFPGGERWAIEIKRGHSSNPSRGFYEACQDLKPARKFVLYAGADRFPLCAGIEAIGLRSLMEILSKAGN
jgi:predicted AAA+ superfamily ATPase